MKNKVNIFWFRRDLRFHDNAGLYYALKSGKPVLPVFIFDKNILDKLNAKDDARVTFIYSIIKKLKKKLEQTGSSIKVLHETPLDGFKMLLNEFDIKAVYTNKDYEPEAIKRDEAIAGLLKSEEIEFHAFKDHVIFEENEVLKGNGEPYTVFTPYSRKWINDFGKCGNSPLSIRKANRKFYKNACF